jgi:CheY-like chemotaxis protein/chemotaxis signal transduction protein
VSLPHLLLVDDSEAILAFERAALSSHYAISTAMTGAEALEKVRQVRPAAVLLDLSMPEMDGDEVLRRMKLDPELESIPIIVVSSERHRERDCLNAGAEAFLAKPIRAPQLAQLVGEVLARTRERAREGSLRVLFVSVGGFRFGLPLEAVDSAVQLPLTQPLPAGPSYLSEYVEIYGEPLCVMDLAARLGMEHGVPRLEQKLVVIRNEDQKLALKVDRVEDPEELPRDAVVPRSSLGGAGEGPLKDLLVAMVHGSRGALPVLEPRALLQRSLWRQLPELLALQAKDA